MGQTHKVVVHRLLTVDSVDERMMEILGNKQQLFDSYARDSVVAESRVLEFKAVSHIVCRHGGGNYQESQEAIK